MYLQLAGLEPLDTAENPLAPGATPYKYKNYYLGQSQDIILPDALFPPNVEGYAKALKSVADLYGKFENRTKKSPAEKVKTEGMSVLSFAALKVIATFVYQAVQALSVVFRGQVTTAARQRITELYNGNNFNVQNLNKLNARQLSDAITQIDSQINMTPRTQFGRQMALARFRLVYQQRFDQVSGGGGFLTTLPGWVLPAALGLGAVLFLRGRK
jgi:hypothetical protein